MYGVAYIQHYVHVELDIEITLLALERIEYCRVEQGKYMHIEQIIIL